MVAKISAPLPHSVLLDGAQANSSTYGVVEHSGHFLTPKRSLYTYTVYLFSSLYTKIYYFYSTTTKVYRIISIS
jgi:hypothetical protein